MKPTALDALPNPPLDYETRSPAPATGWSRERIAFVSIVIGLVSAAVYPLLRPTEKSATSASSAAPAAAHGQGTGVSPDVAAMVDRLAARLQKEPENGAGWQMLAKSQAALGRFTDAASAFRKAEALLPPDADLLADYADVQAMAQSGNFTGEPARLIRSALAINPKHPKALALAGTEAYKRGDFQAAIGYWNKTLEQVPVDSSLAIAVKGSLAEARQRSANPAGGRVGE